MVHLLVDGHNLTGRCFAVMKDLCTSDGTPSGMIHGFFQSLSYAKHLAGVPTEKVIVCWDGGRSVARMELYPEYKANRKREIVTAEDALEAKSFREQITAVQEGLRFIGTKQVQVKDVEADDLIGIFSGALSPHNEACIYSNDHDMHQLVSENISILDPKKGILTKEVIEEWWGVPVDKIPLYKALTGDKSDNITGVPQIGDVRAKQYIAGDEKIIKKVMKHQPTVHRNLRLMTLPKEMTNFPTFSVQQGNEIMNQFFRTFKQDLSKFVRLLQIWELDAILDNLHRW